LFADLKGTGSSPEAREDDARIEVSQRSKCNKKLICNDAKFLLPSLEKYWRSYFPKLPSYNRFIELIPRAISSGREDIKHLKTLSHSGEPQSATSQVCDKFDDTLDFISSSLCD